MGRQPRRVRRHRHDDLAVGRRRRRHRGRQAAHPRLAGRQRLPHRAARRPPRRCWPTPPPGRSRSSPSPASAAPASASASCATPTTSTAAVRRPELGEMVVQTLAGGREHTIDVLADRDGRSVCAVPRRRIEVRSGEVSKGVTVRSPRLQDLAARICAALPARSARSRSRSSSTASPTIPTPTWRSSRSTPATAAGSRWRSRPAPTSPGGSSRSCSACPRRRTPDGWRDGLVMLRYDAAVFVDEADAPA